MERLLKELYVDQRSQTMAVEKEFDMVVEILLCK
jgi:hypothetical protein